MAAKDVRALERIFRGRGAVWAVQDRKDATGLEVRADKDWHGVGMLVQEGVTYRIRAAGSWNVAGVRCTADGTNASPANRWGPIGGLMVAVSGDARYQWVGTNGTFTAPLSGRLVFICNVDSPKDQSRNEGAVFVIVARQ